MNIVSKPTEVWRQDADEPDLWHGDSGVIVNSAALREREAYFDLTRVSATDLSRSETPESLRP